MPTAAPATLLYRFGAYALAANIAGWLLPIDGLYWFLHLLATLILLFVLRAFVRDGRLATESRPSLFVWLLIVYAAGGALYQTGSRYLDRRDTVAYADLQVAHGQMPAAAAHAAGSKHSPAYDYFPFDHGTERPLRLHCAAYPEHTDHCQSAYAHAGSATLIRHHRGLIYEMQTEGHILFAYDSQIAAFAQQLTAERRQHAWSLWWMLLVYTAPMAAFTVFFDRLWRQTPAKQRTDFEAASRAAARPLPGAQNYPTGHREDARFVTLSQRNRRAQACGLTFLIGIMLLGLAGKSLLHLGVGLLLLLPLCYGLWLRYRRSTALSYRATSHVFLLSRWEYGREYTETLPADHFRGVLLRRLPEQWCQLLLLGKEGHSDVLIDEVEGHLFGKPGQLVRMQQHIHRASGLPVLSDGSI